MLLSSHLLYQVQAVCDRVGLFHQGRMVLDGTVKELARRVLGGAYRIHLEATGSAGLQDVLGHLPGVVKLRRNDPNIYQLETENDLRAEVAQAVVTAGGRLLSLNVEAPNLDEVYTGYFHQEVQHVVAS